MSWYWRSCTEAGIHVVGNRAHEEGKGSNGVGVNCIGACPNINYSDPNFFIFLMLVLGRMTRFL